LTSLPLAVVGHGAAATQANFSLTSSAATTTSTGNYYIVATLAPSSCHAYVTIYSPSNAITWNLFEATYSGGSTFGTPSSSSCATSSGNGYSCTIDGGTVSAGTALWLNETAASTANFTTAFSCQ
jgi:hypothetical protein